MKIHVQDGAVCAVETATGAKYACRAAIICTGTYLGGRIIIGDHIHEGGPDGMFAAARLTGCLRELGLRLMRFKTGTPPRVNRRLDRFYRPRGAGRGRGDYSVFL